MTDIIKGNGRCVCGAVNITANNMSKEVGACHCATCRQWSGSPFMAVGCGADVVFEGEENITVFNSSDWAERGFCNQCGSHLFYKLKKNQHYVVPVGLFGDDMDFVFSHQVFIDEKPSFYGFSNSTDDMTGPELMAKFKNC